MSAATEASSFSVGRVAIDLGNRTRRGQFALAQAEVAVGPFNFQGFVKPDGHVDLPGSLRDRDLRRRIAAALRQAVIEELQTRWAFVERRETEGAPV